ncbi:MAG: hypothetical protein M1826_005996 [Phylliscum demangeonii]|nr:MAG: hypothetical protein M1826_005996 [Phylliscum demangeonii]
MSRAKKQKRAGPLSQPSKSRSSEDRHAKRIPAQNGLDPDDTDDEFADGQDEVLLDEGTDAKRRKTWHEDEVLELSDQEVLPDDLSTSDEDSLEAPHEDAAHSVRAEKATRHQQPDGESDVANEEEEEEDAFDQWGPSKHDYYNQDDVETEGDALLEEKEARRIQTKRLQGMSESHFGFDESEWLEGSNARADAGSDLDSEVHVVTEVLPQPQITDAMGPDDKTKLLHLMYPEFGPLAQEFLDLQAVYTKLSGSIASENTATQNQAKSKDSAHRDKSSRAGLLLKYQALTAYLGALSMYFALLTSRSGGSEEASVGKPPSELHNHAIMDCLVRCRGIWDNLGHFEVPESAPALDGVGIAVLEGRDARTASMDVKPAEVTSPNLTSNVPRRKVKLDATLLKDAPQQEDSQRTAEKELADMGALTSRSRLRRVKQAGDGLPSKSTDGDFDLCEEQTLDAYEAAEKSRKKKTLRFYTSQITQKTNKRDRAGRDAGGDTDVPYRERIQDRQARLNAQAEKRGKTGRHDETTALDMADDQADEAPLAVTGRAQNSDEEHYQQLVSATQRRKQAKKALVLANNVEGAVDRKIIVGDDRVGADGKRAIGYTIEKNKGLAPKRGKDVRNPRVKKRKKFAEKQKKLTSAVGLLGQIFDGCVKAYSFFTAAANLGKDSERLLCKIRIEEMRLTVWGREWGVAEGKLEANLDLAAAATSSHASGGNDGLKKMAEMILKQLLDTIGNSKKLKERYGVTEAPSSIKSDGGHMLREREPSSDGNNHGSGSGGGGSGNKIRSGFGDLKLRAKWVIRDKDKFEVLLNDLKDYNDGLERLFPPARIATLQRTWTYELLQTAQRDTDKLNLLETASSGVYPQLTTSASLKQLRINLDTTEPTKFKPTSALKIPRKALTFDAADEGRRIDGRYRRTDDGAEEAVVIEWITFEPDTDLDTRLMIYQRVDNLARMVHSASNRHPDLHTLDGVGYLDDGEHLRYGVIYRCPAAARARSPDTLASLIDSAQLRTPDLNERFQLAHTLSVALWAFHSLDWLHKTFCASNILLFEGAAELRRPYVAGFDSSRPDYLHEMTVAAKTDMKQELYRHPDSLGLWRQSYRKSFDIYSLGLVLLEIGLWKRVTEFQKPKHTPATFRDKVILPVLLPRLASKTGRLYQAVVRRCLQGSAVEGADADDAGKTMEWIVFMLESLRV